jgi:hypothetical protein
LKHDSPPEYGYRNAPAIGVTAGAQVVLEYDLPDSIAEGQCSGDFFILINRSTTTTDFPLRTIQQDDGTILATMMPLAF